MIGPEIRPGTKANEQGYALLAAVAAIAVFGALALALGTATRVSIASGTGELARARADAAADAGLALAEHGLVAGDDAMLALVRGRQHELEFDGSQLIIRIGDERGKIPLNHIEGETITRMFEQAGLSGANLAIASDSLQDWLDDDDVPRSDGAEAVYYAVQGYTPRNGGLLSVDELARVRGIGPRLVARLRPYVTTDPDVRSVDATNARPQALAAMQSGGALSPDAITRQHEAEGEQVAIDITRKKDFLNRPLTISVDADTPDGGHAHHEAVVVITGNPEQPLVVHAVR